MLSRAAILGIAGYQRWLSPRKGYACAYRVAHGGTGCSGYAKAAIADQGLWRAVPLIRARFAACHAAALVFAAEQDGGKRRRHWDFCDPSAACDSAGGGCCRSGRHGADGMDGCDCTPDGCG